LAGFVLFIVWLFQSGPFDLFGKIDSVGRYPFIQTLVEVFIVNVEIR